MVENLYDGFCISYGSDEALVVSLPENYFEEAMSAAAVSIGVSFFALNTLAWKSSSEKVVDLYYALRNYAVEHSEGTKIKRLIV